jgi:hypothetical protein
MTGLTGKMNQAYQKVPVFSAFIRIYWRIIAAYGLIHRVEPAPRGATL